MQGCERLCWSSAEQLHPSLACLDLVNLVKPEQTWACLKRGRTRVRWLTPAGGITPNTSPSFLTLRK